MAITLNETRRRAAEHDTDLTRRVDAAVSSQIAAAALALREHARP